MTDERYPGMPRWVKLFLGALVAIAVVIVLVLVVGTALGLHSPMGHGGTMGPEMTPHR